MQNMPLLSTVLLAAGMGFLSLLTFRSMLARASRNDEIIERLDAMMKHMGVAFPPVPSETVMAVARRDGLIAGIRAYRTETGAGLAAAKRVVEEALRKESLLF